MQSWKSAVQSQRFFIDFYGLFQISCPGIGNSQILQQFRVTLHLRKAVFLEHSKDLFKKISLDRKTHIIEEKFIAGGDVFQS